MKDKKPINIEIGARIKNVRETRGLTQERFAEQLDVSTQYISDLERGVTGASITNIVKICEILSVSCDYILMGRMNEKNSSEEISNRLQYLSKEQMDVIEKGINVLIEALLL